MKRARALIISVVVVVAVVAIGAISLSSVLSRCVYSETKRSFSPDGKFYTQVQATTCREDEKSHYSLVMGAPDRKDMIVLLDLRSSLDEMHYSWREGAGLQVSVPPSAIAKRYSDYEGWPRVVMQGPAASRVPED
jgi:hypothetical protein